MKHTISAGFNICLDELGIGLNDILKYYAPKHKYSLRTYKYENNTYLISFSFESVTQIFKWQSNLPPTIASLVQYDTNQIIIKLLEQRYDRKKTSKSRRLAAA